jgi:hypothetical protein
MVSVGQFSVSSTYLQQKKHQLADVTDNWNVKLKL